MQKITKKRVCSFLNKKWKESRGTVLFFGCVVLPFKSAVADLNWVPTGSMNPTIVEGDMVFIDKLAYDLRLPFTLHSLQHRSDPERGDISVLFSPEDDIRLVKRVIGIPGDEIKMVNNMVFINGKPLEYSPLSAEQSEDMEAELRNHSLFAQEKLGDRAHSVMSVPGIPTDKRSMKATVVPNGQYFVMGDNRDMSKDSRYFGFAKRELFVGRAKGVVVSFNILDKFQPRFGRFFSPLN